MIKEKTIKIPCGGSQSLGWDCNRGHLCDKCKMLLHILSYYEQREETK